MDGQSSGSIGATIGVIIVVLLLAAGGAYFFLMQPRAELVVDESGEPPASGSDAVRDIEADLNATQSADVEADLQELDRSF